MTAPSFLASEIGEVAPENALFHVLPFPLERSVSYGGGAAKGPAAILKASQQLELFDGIGRPGLRGIHTHPFVDVNGEIDQVLTRGQDTIRAILESYNGLPLIIGGEHTVTLAALRALKKAGGAFGVVQFDAHADLRNVYQDDFYSHACVMRRAMDLDIPVMQIGVRALSFEEHLLRGQASIPHVDAVDIAAGHLPVPLVPEDFPERIYITVDIDALDPSVLPATGTPEPGGLSWYTTVNLLSELARDRKVIGADLVELAPRPGDHVSDFTAAKLLYTLMGIVERNEDRGG